SHPCSASVAANAAVKAVKRQVFNIVFSLKKTVKSVGFVLLAKPEAAGKSNACSAQRVIGNNRELYSGYGFQIAP
ncbi:MAG: hypothetical protein WCD24_05770, partial [Serratia inhibens]|uniref:hypothetical protein n=1 Tax=Serratia inhibens TaxID=2338073 RepID=UPI003C7CB688